MFGSCYTTPYNNPTKSIVIALLKTPLVNVSVSGVALDLRHLTSIPPLVFVII
jgi:hypothetical protein